MKRVIVRVKPRKKEWSVSSKKFGAVGLFALGNAQERAVTFARDYCRRIYKRGHLVQLVVHGRKGIRFEHTYGKDPRRSKG